ncbi:MULTISPECIES: sensor histidine kinase [unclassified Microbispora]|nr:sensor histidine kinase [Microbispora sp. SCL1-1]
MAGTLLEHTARGERARIARELHDVVAHHISMVAVQAETARVAVPGMPSAGAERLRAIGDTARSALTEMRRLLGVLREDDRERADLRPQPGLRLTELNALLDEARDASGTAVRLVLSGSPAVLDPGVELAAYRIIQEALTNARRHAPGAAVDVELHYTRDALRLRVRDNGPGIPFSSGTATGTGGSDGLGVPGGAVMPGAAVPSGDARVPDGMAGHGFAEHESATRGPAGRVLAGQESAGHESAGHTFAGHGLADHESARYEAARHGLTEHESAARGSAGHGLTGMRERAAAVGGELCIGSAAGGGFVVEACLPRLPDADDFQASGAADGPDRWWGPAAPAGSAGGCP